MASKFQIPLAKCFRPPEMGFFCSVEVRNRGVVWISFYDIFNARGAAHKHVVYGRWGSFQTEFTVRRMVRRRKKLFRIVVQK